VGCQAWLKSFDLQAAGTLGHLLLAKERGIIRTIQPMLSELRTMDAIYERGARFIHPT